MSICGPWIVSLDVGSHATGRNILRSLRPLELPQGNQHSQIGRDRSPVTSLPRLLIGPDVGLTSHHYLLIGPENTLLTLGVLTWTIASQLGGSRHSHMNSMKLVIPLHFISLKKTQNDAVTPLCQSQFTPKMKANAVPRLLSSLVWIHQSINVTEWQVSWNSWNCTCWDHLKLSSCLDLFFTVMNSMKLVILLHFISWKKTPNAAVTPQR